MRYNKRNPMKQTSEMEYVDLGLPSGLKWAKCNLGAKTETDCGDYFQWGDIEDKSKTNCNWESYKYGDFSNLSKYNTGLDDIGGTIDNKTTFDTEDDAATQIMGGKWRMPTQTEFQELLKNTNQKWVEDFNGSGVSGRKFTSKTDESKYIFIPAAGSCNGGSVNYVGGIGYIWSSSLSTSYPDNAWYLYFHSDNCFMDDDSRCVGLSIRPVMG